MSNTMLLGILTMPPGLWDESDVVGNEQRHQRYLQAAKLIEDLTEVLTDMTREYRCDIEANYTLNDMAFPSKQRAFNNDMEIILKAEKLLAET
jgi:hypothetical protein